MEYKDYNSLNCPHKEDWILMEVPSLFADETRQMDHNIDNPIHVPSNLKYHTFDYTQLYRGVRSCLYEQTLHGKTVGFEVFLICIQPEVTLNGVTYKERERWPKDEDFLSTAWSFWTLAQGMAKYRMLEENYDE